MMKRSAMFLLVISAVSAIFTSLPVWANGDNKLTIVVTYNEETTPAATKLTLYNDQSEPWQYFNYITNPTWTGTTINNIPSDSKVTMTFGKETTCSVLDRTDKVIPRDITEVFITVIQDGDLAPACVADFTKPIKNCDELQNISNVTNYSLMPENDTDIDCSGIEFTPISNFSGSLIGNGKTIKNLTIKDNGQENIGLFEDFSGSISDVNFKDVIVGGTYSASNFSNRGLIAGKSSNAVIENINVTNLKVYGGNISRTSISGGIVGDAVDTKLSKIIIQDINFTNTAFIGGLVGKAGKNVALKDDLVAGWTDDLCPNASSHNENACVPNSCPAGATGCAIGGLIGIVVGENVTIDSSATRPNKKDNEDVGTRITSHSLGGGLIGTVAPEGATLKINNSYSRLRVGSLFYAGGIIGYSAGINNNIELNNVYYAAEIVAQYHYPNHEHGSKTILGGMIGSSPVNKPYCKPNCGYNGCYDPNCHVLTRSVVSHNNFYDSDVKGQYTSGPGDDNRTVNPNTRSNEAKTVDMQKPAIYTNAEWPTDIWCLPQNSAFYPKLTAIEGCQ